MPQILIVDDHPLVREAVSCILHALLDQSMIREAGSVNEACQTARLHPQLDMILFDLMLPDVSGLDGLIAIRRHFPIAPVLVFTALDDAKIAAKAMALNKTAAKRLSKLKLNPIWRKMQQLLADAVFIRQ